MKRIEINSSVEKGTLKTNRKFIADAIKTFEGSQIIITIEKRKKKRSNNQNSFYWAVVIPILQDAFYNATGEYHSIQEVHDAMKANFCFKEIVSIETGEIIKMPNSTTQLTTIEWEEYIDKIRQWAFTFLNISIGFPNEQIELNLT